MIVPLSSIPSSRDGFYAVNNQFLANGPKGYIECKILEDGDMFIRIDFPGVPPECIRVTLDSARKALKIFAAAPHEKGRCDFSHRQYGTVTGLVCDCCKISTFTSHMSDGVLRILISKTQLISPGHYCIGGIAFLGGPERRQGGGYGSDKHTFPHDTDPRDPALSGRVLQPHPFVNYGSEMAYESKQLPNGGLVVRVDMPGVPQDMFSVSVEKGRVTVFGEAPAVSHDSAGRTYLGDVAMLDSLANLYPHQIKTLAKNGVIHLIIPPVSFPSSTDDMFA